MLDIYLRRFVFILYFLYATKPQDDHRQYLARKICLDSSVTMASYASSESGTKQSLKDFSYDDDYTCLKTRSGVFFETALLHSIIVIFFEPVTQLKEQDSFIEQSKDFRQPLKKILHDACDLLAARITVAENNVKRHLLFPAALGQIEAIEAGTSPSQRAVEGAGRSADICLGLLADKLPILTPESDNTLQDGIDFGMQDWGMDFVMPDGRLFSGWDGGQCDDWNHTVT
jgi:hypothetical protein